MNIDVYNDAIHDIWIYLLLNMLPILVGGTILTAIVLIGLFKKVIKKLTAFLLLIICTILLAYPIIEISIFNYDLQHENFVVYYGTFDYKTSGIQNDFRYNEQ